MKVWWVYAWDQYYPLWDNFVASFATEEEANEYVRLESNYDHASDHYRVINITSRL
jgi:hypothetical protein